MKFVNNENKIIDLPENINDRSKLSNLNDIRYNMDIYYQYKNGMCKVLKYILYKVKYSLGFFIFKLVVPFVSI
jgi:hypothetical protein